MAHQDPFWKTLFAPLLPPGRRKRRRLKRPARRAHLESLEDRRMMATLYWDPDGDANNNDVLTGVGLGGGGNWTTGGSALWYNSATNSHVAWSNGDSAVFTGAAGSVSVAAGVSAQSLAFQSSNYVLQNGSISLTGAHAIDVGAELGATISTPITGTAGLAKTGDGKLTLSGTNTYTGATTIDAGTLQVGAGGAAGTLAAASQITIGASGTLAYYRNDSGAEYTIANIISGSGALTFSGPGGTQLGRYSLTGANTSFSGPISIDHARLYVTNPNPLGSSSITVNELGQLMVGPGAYGNNLTLNSTGWIEAAGNHGALRLAGGDWTGGVTLASDSSIGAYSGQSGTVSGVISDGGQGFGVTKQGGGSVTLAGSASNTYTGTTVVDVGILTLGKTAGAYAISGDVQMGAGNANQPHLRMSQSEQFAPGVFMTAGNGTNAFSRFDLLGTTQTLAGIESANNSLVIQNGGAGVGSAADATLTLDGDNDYLFAGYLRNYDNVNSGGKLNLVKSGSGKFTLASNTNSYTGATTIDAGTLQVGAGGAAGALAAASQITIGASGTLAYYRNDSGAEHTIANSIGGTGALTFSSPGGTQVGRYTLAGDNSSYSGDISIEQARLLTTNPNQLGDASIEVKELGQLLIGSGAYFNNLTLDSTGWVEAAGNFGALRIAGGDWAGSVTLAGDSSIGASSGHSGTVSGVISDGGNGFGFTKRGTGTITLAGSTSNIYTGTTVVDGGVLILGKTAGAYAISGAVQMGAGNANQPHLRMSQSEQFAPGVVMTAGNGANAFTRFELLGTTQTLAGIESPNNSLVIQNGGVNVGSTADATLTLNGDDDYLFAGYLRNFENVNSGGKLKLVKSGSGTQRLSGSTVAYTGATVVDAGTLQLWLTPSYASPTIVEGGAVLELAGTANAEHANWTGDALTLSDGATLNKTNTGYDTINAGNVVVNGDVAINITNSGLNNQLFIGGAGGTGLTGTGTLTVTNSGSSTTGLTLRLGAHGTHFDGALIVSGGALNLGSGAALALDSADLTLTGARLTMDNTAYSAYGAANASLKSLSGDAASTVALGSQTLTVGINDGDEGDFAGVIFGTTGTLTKTGSGTQTLSGEINLPGATTLLDGVLQLGPLAVVAGTIVEAGGVLQTPYPWIEVILSDLIQGESTDLSTGEMSPATQVVAAADWFQDWRGVVAGAVAGSAQGPVRTASYPGSAYFRVDAVAALKNVAGNSLVSLGLADSQKLLVWEERSDFDWDDAYWRISAKPLLVDLDADSDNDGQIDANDDPLEADAPGKLVALGGELAEVKLWTDTSIESWEGIAGSLTLSGIDGGKIKVWGDENQTIDLDADDDGVVSWDLAGSYPTSIWIEGVGFGQVNLRWALDVSGVELSSDLVTLTVFGAPTAVDDAAEVDEDSSLEVPVLLNDSGAPGAGGSLSVVALGTPSHGGTVEIVSGGVQYTPASNFFGTETFSYTVRDSITGGEAAAVVTVTVAPVDDDAAASDNDYAALENSLLSGDVIGDDTGDGADVDVDSSSPLVIVEVDGAAERVGAAYVLPSGATLLVRPDGTFDYDPRTSSTLNALAAGATYTDSFHYTVAANDGDTATALVEILVTGVNDAPLARPNHYTFPINGLLTGNLLTDETGDGVDEDPDAGDALVVSAVQGAPANVGNAIQLNSGATLTVQADGSFTYAPSAAMGINTPIGSDPFFDSFSYSVSDGQGGFDSTTVILTIESSNHAPVASDNFYATLKTTPIAGNLMADDTGEGNDYDLDAADLLNVVLIDGQAISAETVLTLASGATLTISPDGSFVYDPTTSSTLASLSGEQTATDSFVYAISDPTGATATAEVEILVEAAATPPLARNDRYLTHEETPLAGNVVTDQTGDGPDFDPEGGALTLTEVNGQTSLVGSSITLASGAVLVVHSDGTFTYDPSDSATLNALSADEHYWESFSYTVVDPEGLTATADVEILVVGSNDPPIARDNAYTTGDRTVVNGSLIGDDTGEGADEEVDLQDVLLVVAVDGQEVNVGQALALASGATLLVHGDGTFTYDPTTSPVLLALLEGETFADSFTYTISDGRGGISEAEVLIEVEGVNALPTLDSIDNAPTSFDRADIGAQVVGLNGISAGDGEDQPLSITVVSSNPDLVPTPTIAYTAGATTAELTFDPVDGRAGTSVITVKVMDGGADRNLATLADNAEFSREFTVVVAPVIQVTGASTADSGGSYSLSLDSRGLELDEWTVDWGDGLVETFDGATTVVSHVFNALGLHEVLATAAQGAAAFAAAAKSVIVKPAAGQNLIVNGSFEADPVNSGTYKLFSSITGWTRTGGNTIEIQDNIPGLGGAADGAQFVELDSTGPSTIAQTIATTPGQVYSVSFAYRARSPRSGENYDVNRADNNMIGVSLTNAVTSNEFGDGIWSTDNYSSWSVATFKFQATGNSSTISFSDLGIPDGLYYWRGSYLDDVSIVAEPIPDLSVDDVLVVEGDAGQTIATFTVSLSEASEFDVTFEYATANGFAEGGTDYLSTNGTLTFPAGVQTLLVHVPVLGDEEVETNEFFLLKLISSLGATIVDGIGVGVIEDDDWDGSPEAFPTSRVDIDADTNNDGGITEDEDPYEERAPGKILPKGARAETRLSEQTGLSTFGTYEGWSLKLYTEETTRISFWNAASGGVALGTSKTWSMGGSPETVWTQRIGGATSDEAFANYSLIFNSANNSALANYELIVDRVRFDDIAGDLDIVKAPVADALEMQPGGMLELNAEELTELRLSPTDPSVVEGRYALVFGDKLKIWKNANGTEEVLSGDFIFDATATTTVYVEGVVLSSALAAETVKLRWRGGSLGDASSETSTHSLLLDQVAFTVLKVDLDIDSDNSNGLTGGPNRDQAEDVIEADESLPGKYIVANKKDVNNNGKPDYADFDKTTLVGQFTPLVLELPEMIDLAIAKIRFGYAVSDPDPSQPSDDNSLLRLWIVNSDTPRNPLKLKDNGSFVQSGEYYSSNQLKFDGRTANLYIEGVRAGATEITVEVDPDGSGIWQTLSDAVRVTVLDVDLDIDATADGIDEYDDRLEAFGFGQVILRNKDNDSWTREGDLERAPIANENNLAEVKIQELANGMLDDPEGWQMRLAFSGDLPSIKLWGAEDKSQPLSMDDLQAGWAVGDPSIPASFWVEGYKLGAVEIKLILENTGAGIEVSDQVKITIHELTEHLHQSKDPNGECGCSAPVETPPGLSVLIMPGSYSVGNSGSPCGCDDDDATSPRHASQNLNTTQPIFTVSLTLPSGGGSFDRLEVKAIIDGEHESTTFNLTTDPNLPAELQAGNTYTYGNFNDNPALTNLPTGVYNLSLVVTAISGDLKSTNHYNKPYLHINRKTLLDVADQIYEFDGGVALLRGDNSFTYYFRQPSGSYVGSGRSHTQITDNPGGGWTATLIDGVRQIFDAAGRLLKWIDTNDNQTIFSHIDADGDGKAFEVASITYPLGRQTTFGYNSSGQITTRTDFAGRVTSYGYTGAGYLATITHPDPDDAGPLLSSVDTYEYSGGNLTKWIDAEGFETNYIYDQFNRLVSTHHPDGSTWQYDYGQNVGLPGTTAGDGSTETPYQLVEGDEMFASYIDGNGHTTTYVIDDYGNYTKMIDALGNVTEIEMDGGGHPIQRTDPDPDGDGPRRASVFNYKWSHGELIKTTWPDPDGSGPRQPASQSSAYNDIGRILRHTDELGRTTNFDYDGGGNLLSQSQVVASGPDVAWSFTYTSVGDLNGLVQTETDPLGRTTTYAYYTNSASHDYGWLRSITYADATQVQFEYDAAGNVTAYIDELGRLTEYEYDRLDRLTRVIEADPDGALGPQTSPITQYEYDRVHNLTALVDATGLRTEYTYDGVHQLVEVTEAVGTALQRETHYTYDFNGNLTQVVDPLGRVTSMTYDALNRLTSVTQADPGTGDHAAPVTTYHYDNVGNLTEVVDPLGNTTRYRYDERYRVVEMTEEDPDTQGGANRRSTLYAYDNADQLIATTDPRGFVTRYQYDDLGRLTQVILPDLDGSVVTVSDLPIYSYQYDAVGNLIAMIDPEARTTTYTYDARNRLKTVAEPAPDVSNLAVRPTTRYFYDAAGQLVQIVDPLLRSTEYEYDDLGRLIKQTLPDIDQSVLTLNDRPITRYAYDAVGNLTAMTDPLGDVTEYAYDALHRLQQVIEEDPDVQGGANNPVTEYTYDAADQLLFVEDPLGRVTSFRYDALGRLTREVAPDPTTGAGTAAGMAPSAGTPFTTYTYDAVGNRLSAANALGYTTNWAFDNLYRLKSETDANGDATHFSYDANDNLLTLTDPVDNTTSWIYDRLNRATQETNELGHSRTFGYDLVGNLTEKTDRNGRVTEYEYDGLHRRTAEVWKEGASTLRTISFSYDLAGQLLSTDDLDHDYSYQYDGLGRVVENSQQIAGLAPTVTFASAYDLAGNRTQLAAQIGATADFVNDYQYDHLHRLTKLTQQAQPGGAAIADKRIDFSYDGAGQRDQIARYADLAGTKLVAATDFSFDLVGRLTGMAHAQGATSLVSHTWQFDAANRLTQYVNSIDGTVDYNYDDRDQLVGADYDYQADEDYAYDENGNRLTANGSSYTTGPNNQLLSDGVYEYEYDNEGNRTRRVKIADGMTTVYSWDHRNRLVSVTEYDDEEAFVQQVSYVYDFSNRLVSRTHQVGTNAPTTGYFFYDGAQITLVLDESGVVEHRLLWSDAVDQLLSDENSSGEVHWALTDHLGTIRDWSVYDEVLDETTIANHITYDAFGRRTSETNPSPDNFNLGFTGRWTDSDTGLQWNLNRWYDLHVGRWLSEDPIGFGDGPNIYMYVHNGPLNHTDPTGNSAWGKAGRLIVEKLTKQGVKREWYQVHHIVTREFFRDAKIGKWLAKIGIEKNCQKNLMALPTPLGKENGFMRKAATHMGGNIEEYVNRIGDKIASLMKQHGKGEISAEEAKNAINSFQDELRKGLSNGTIALTREEQSILDKGGVLSIGGLFLLGSAATVAAADQAAAAQRMNEQMHKFWEEDVPLTGSYWCGKESWAGWFIDLFNPVDDMRSALEISGDMIEAYPDAHWDRIPLGY